MYERIYLSFMPNSLNYDCKACANFCCNYGYVLMDYNSARNALSKIPEVQPFLEYRSKSSFRLDMGGNSCWYLVNGECLLHDESQLELKPISCRLFPLRLIKGPADYIIVNHEICPTTKISKQSFRDVDIYNLVKDASRLYSDLIMDFGVVYKKKSYFAGIEQTWEERFEYENRYKNQDSDYSMYIYPYNFEDDVIKKIWPFWSQLKTSPIFLETDAVIVNKMLPIYEKYFTVYFNRTKNYIKAIHYANKCTNNDLMIKYKKPALKDTTVLCNDKDEYYILTERRQKFSIPHSLYTELKSNSFSTLDEFAKRNDLNKYQVYNLLECFIKLDGVKWEVLRYEDCSSH